MSTLFVAKPTPSDEKLRGGYYTPAPVAEFVAKWVSEAGTLLLEPSCGDGAILRFLCEHGSAIGVELFPDEAAKARANTSARVDEGDFFEWMDESRRGVFDGVAGNPPYIRFGSWEAPYRDRALDLMRSEGLKPTKLTNAWLPFVVGSLVAARPGGRVGLVVPAELLQVSYAAQLRAYLVDSCEEITVVSFSELIFPGILQEVVVLLAVKGSGPAAIRTVEVQNASHLTDVTLDGSTKRAALHESEKWTKYYLSASAIEMLRSVRADSRLSRLGTYAAVNVGVVTGRNSFFCMTSDQATEWDVEPHTVNLLSRSAQFTGARYTPADFDSQAAHGAKSRLLAVAAEVILSEHPALERYVELGEAEEVHLGYKCSIRASWWVVPSVSIPDGFMLRQISSVLRLTSNQARATSSDTVHRVFVRPGVSMEQLAVVALNSITLAMSEIMGRSYGGGLLELEPSECVSLPVPDPRLVSGHLIDAVDSLLRDGNVDDAIALVDQMVLIDGAGFKPSTVDEARRASTTLRHRRTGRGRKSKLA